MSKQKQVDVWTEDWGRLQCEKIDEFGICQKEVAMMLGFHERYLYKLLHGKQVLSAKNKKRIEEMIERMNPNHAYSMCFDYCRIRFPKAENQTMETIANKLLHIPFEWWQEESAGWNNYEIMYSYGDIFLCASSRDDRLGILLEMRGRGCRQFEIYLINNDRTWIDFFWDISKFDGVYKRIDIAVDDRHGMLDIPTLAGIAERGGMIGKCKSASFIKGMDLRFEKEGMGDTLYIGSKKSELYFCLYQKDLEQYRKKDERLMEVETELRNKYDISEMSSLELEMAVKDKFLEEASVRNRLEIRLSDERAEEMICRILEKYSQGNDDFMEDAVFSVINNYISFCVPKSKDSDIWVWHPMWEQFLDGHRDKIRLCMSPKKFDETSSLNWLYHQVFATFKAMVIRDYVQGRNNIVNALNNTAPKASLIRVLDREDEAFDKIRFKLNDAGEVYVSTKDEKFVKEFSL